MAIKMLGFHFSRINEVMFWLNRRGGFYLDFEYCLNVYCTVSCNCFFFWHNS